MRASKAGWKRNDIDRLYEGFGFIIENRKRHDKAFHPEFPQVFGMLPRHTKIAKGYVDEAVKNIDKLIKLAGIENEKK